ncbi:LacI family DNA-binding transcriptional regulator, partial [Streptomyces microflavus]|uniref:LacI family DNA-binding transcriptional regulator n=1 Tax=Streptomyces microflavus TaxID=1919 RepID=UPI003BB67BE7
PRRAPAPPRCPRTARTGFAPVQTPPRGPAALSAASRPTSKDVARAAGVSQAAVSLVLGGKWPGRVSAATAER